MWFGLFRVRHKFPQVVWNWIPLYTRNANLPWNCLTGSITAYEWKFGQKLLEKSRKRIRKDRLKWSFDQPYLRLYDYSSGSGIYSHAACSTRTPCPQVEGRPGRRGRYAFSIKSFEFYKEKQNFTISNVSSIVQLTAVLRMRLTDWSDSLFKRFVFWNRCDPLIVI